MTDAEVLALKSGDVVTTTIGMAAADAEVQEIKTNYRRPYAVLRRCGRDIRGALFPKVGRYGNGLLNPRRKPRGDNVTANVFADWLEEHGEAKAASMLREAFPMTETT